MNQRKAKALRKAVGFHPGAEREYSVGRPSRFFSGHVTSTGARRSYQNAKRSKALGSAILGAA